MIKSLALALATAAAGAAVITAPTAAAEPGCVTQPWWRGEIMRMTTRILCDGPMRPDGSWLRVRSFVAPSYVANGYSSCYGGRYYSSCTYTSPRVVPAYDSGQEFYTVTPETVLPDEPGYIAGTVA
jgi:hypothetical protein